MDYMMILLFVIVALVIVVSLLVLWRKKWLLNKKMLAIGTGLIVILSGMGVLLSGGPPASDTRYEYYNAGYDGGYAADSTTWRAQTFTIGTVGANEAHDITSVKLRLNRNNNPGTVTVSIRATDGSGKPTGADLTSGTTNGNTLTTLDVGEWREITITAYELQAGTKYAIVTRAAGTGSNYIMWKGDFTTPSYTGGSIVSSTNSGSTWTIAANYDFMFEEYGTAAAPANNAPNITTNSENPRNQSTVVGLSLAGNYSHFNISVSDINDASQNMNITWTTNESGTWTTMGTNASVNNGTYYCTNVSWVDTNSHKYWWKVILNDGCGGWDNETYYFTTEPGIGTLHEYYNATPDSAGDIYTTNWMAQTFTVGTVGANEDHVIDRVRLLMFRIGSPGIMTVRIRPVNATGHPTYGNLTNGTINANLFTTVTTGRWCEILLSPPVTLSASTKYSIVVNCSGSSSTNSVSWKLLSRTPAYAGGSYIASSNSGVYWAINTGVDFMFMEYGTASEGVDYTDTIRCDGTDYFVWLGSNTTAYWVNQSIVGMNSATESISIWNRSTWSNGLWQTYNGTRTGVNWTVHTFQIIKTILADAGTQIITMTANPTMNYDNTRAVILVNTSTNKGYNFSAYNLAAATTLSAINTTAIGLTAGDFCAKWNRTTYAWDIWTSGFGPHDHNVSRWDVIQTKVSNAETWNT